MLENVDVEVLEIVEDLVGWIVKMDKKDVINLHRVYRMLLMDEDAERLVEKLRALSILMMPYETEGEVREVVEERQEKTKVEFELNC